MNLKLVAVLLISTSLVACSSDRKTDVVDDSLNEASGVSSEYADSGSVYGDYNVIGEEELGRLDSGSQEQLVALAGDRVYFNFNSSEINTNAQKTLMRQITWLKEHSDINVLVEGHADERGTREYNLALGEKRASAAKNFLIANGISSSRISVISYGREHPEALGSDESAWSKNRRAVTVVTK